MGAIHFTASCTNQQMHRTIRTTVQWWNVDWCILSVCRLCWATRITQDPNSLLGIKRVGLLWAHGHVRKSCISKATVVAWPWIVHHNLILQGTNWLSCWVPVFIRRGLASCIRTSWSMRCRGLNHHVDQLLQWNGSGWFAIGKPLSARLLFPKMGLQINEWCCYWRWSFNEWLGDSKWLWHLWDRKDLGLLARGWISDAQPEPMGALGTIETMVSHSHSTRLSSIYSILGFVCG